MSDVMNVIDDTVQFHEPIRTNSSMSTSFDIVRLLRQSVGQFHLF
jgi:hypothetical protein